MRSTNVCRGESVPLRESGRASTRARRRGASPIVVDPARLRQSEIPDLRGDPGRLRPAPGWVRKSRWRTPSATSSRRLAETWLVAGSCPAGVAGWRGGGVAGPVRRGSFPLVLASLRAAGPFPAGHPLWSGRTGRRLAGHPLWSGRYGASSRRPPAGVPREYTAIAGYAVSPAPVCRPARSGSPSWPPGWRSAPFRPGRWRCARPAPRPRRSRGTTS